MDAYGSNRLQHTKKNQQEKNITCLHIAHVVSSKSSKDTTVQFHRSLMGEMSKTLPLMYYESVANIMLCRQTNVKPLDNLKLRHIFSNSV